MGAIFGIVGDARDEELALMAERMPHRGRHCRIVSPASDVHLGELSHVSIDESGSTNIVTDAQINLPPAAAESAGNSISILQKSIREKKIEAFAHIDGLFAIAFWDSESNSLFLATDRIAFKQIYYIRTPTRLAFASEYKALLALDDVAAEPNKTALQYYLSSRLSLHTCSSLLSATPVFRGTVLTYNRNKVASKAYWTPKLHLESRSMKAHSELVATALRLAVEKQVRGLPEVALTLSGGLDSAGLLAILHKLSLTPKVSTYSIGFGHDDPELEGAQVTAGYFGTKHHAHVFDVGRIPKILPRLVWLMEDCSGREEAVLQYEIESMIGQKHGAVMAGHGADMVFAGMPRHKLLRMAELSPIGRTGAMELYEQTQLGTKPKTLSGKLMSRLVFKGQDVAPPSILGDYDKMPAPSVASLDQNLLDNLISNSLNYHEPILEQTETLSLMPYLASEVIDCALSIPIRFKITPFRQKIVLRNALNSLLPREIVSRPKAIQQVKHDRQLSQVVDSMADEYLSENVVRERAFFDMREIDSLRKVGHGRTYSGDQLYRLWAAINIEIWCRHFLDNRGLPWKLG